MAMGGNGSARPWIEIESFVEAYERRWAERGHADVADFLPPRQLPVYAQVLRELVRVDLEYRWENGCGRRVEEYTTAYPELLQDRDGIKEIAFEEYRLRRQVGEHAAPAEYEQRFGICTAGWPTTEADQNTHATVAPGEAASFTNATGDAGPDSWHGVYGPDQLEFAWPAIGATFLGFRLLRELGRGAFGRVYLARQEDLADRPVVLKVTADRGGEAQALAQLQHRSIVPIFSVHREPPFLALCMPFLGTTTLADVLRVLYARPHPPGDGAWLAAFVSGREQAAAPAVGGTGSSLDREAHAWLATTRYVEAATELGRQLAEGLAHAHERGILHRDLKPANVLLTGDGQAMLLDFSLAQDTKQGASATAAYIGGTLPYMAPEQLEAFHMGRAAADPRGDIYALGLILSELLSGRSLFPIRSGPLTSVLEQMCADRQKIPDVRRMNPAVSPALAAVVGRCLAPELANRYQSARALEEDLARHQAHYPLKHTPEPSLRERMGKWMRRHPRLRLGSLLACFVLILLALAGAMYRSSERRLAQAEARDTLYRFHDELRVSRFLLTAPAPSEPELADGIALARQALARYEPVARSPEGLAYLDYEDLERLPAELRELRFFLAEALRTRAEGLPKGTEQSAILEEAVALNRRAEADSSPEDNLRLLTLQRASLAELSGDAAGARSLRERARAMPARGTRDEYLLAVQQIGKGEYRDALALLLDAKRRDPQDAYIAYALGLCYSGLGMPERADAALDTSIGLWPRFHGSYYRRGAVHLELKEYEDALADFNQALRLRPGYVPAQIDRALVYAARKEVPAALEDLTEALRSPEAPTRVYLMRARVREQAGDRAGAQADRAEGLRRRPTDELSWVARGLARLPADRNGALADMEEALQLNPRSRVALEDKAHILAEWLNRPTEARAVLDRVVSLYPDYAQARAGRGVLLARLGQRTEALGDAEASLRLDTRPENLYQVACIYALTSRSQSDDRLEAFRLLTTALRGGYGFDLLETDHDLDAIRKLPEFHRLVAAAQTLNTRGPQR
jgi:serine/threonine protein kinase/Flp pilus assembly protein TadD